MFESRIQVALLCVCVAWCAMACRESPRASVDEVPAEAVTAPQDTVTAPDASEPPVALSNEAQPTTEGPGSPTPAKPDSADAPSADRAAEVPTPEEADAERPVASSDGNVKPTKKRLPRTQPMHAIGKPSSSGSLFGGSGNLSAQTGGAPWSPSGGVKEGRRRSDEGGMGVMGTRRRGPPLDGRFVPEDGMPGSRDPGSGELWE